MKPIIIRVFLFGLCFCGGCDQVVTVPHGSGSSDFLAFLQTMTNVRVTYSGMTNLHSFVKQGSLDPGVTFDLWMPRGMEFDNRDSMYTLAWQDSQFSTKSCFAFGQVDPPFAFSYDCGDVSLIRGIYHSGIRSISSLVCLFKKYDPGDDQNSFLSQSGTLAASAIELESFGDDSVSFTVKYWTAGSVSLGYNYDEQSYGAIRQLQIEAFDTLGTQYRQICRVIFYKR